MANTLICDSCDQPITDMDNRVQILIFSTEPIADPRLDLCSACSTGLKKDSKLKRGHEKAKARIQAMMEPVVPDTPVVDGVHPETGTYLDVPPPPTTPIPGIDPRTGVGHAKTSSLKLPTGRTEA